MKKLQGVIPIVHMPYLKSGEIDQATLKKEVDWTYSVGVDGICLAMVSDLLRLTEQERLTLTTRLVEYNQGRGLVIISCGAESTHQAVAYAQAAEKAGADAVMAIPPISQALTESELAEYFGSIATSVDLPLIVQDASGYVGKAMSCEFQAGLLKEYGAAKIYFKPEANPVGQNISRLRDLTQGKARILEGSGGVLLMDSWRRGVVGTMPGCDLIDAIVPLWKALLAGNEEKAYSLYLPVAAIAILQGQAGLDGYMAMERTIMKKRGLFPSDSPRQPVAYSLDKETRLELDRLLKKVANAISEAG